MFDRLKTKHHLLHASISLTTILICMTYALNSGDILRLGRLWESIILVLIFIGEILKVTLTKYFKRKEKEPVQQQGRQKAMKKSQTWITFGNIFKAIILQGICTMLFAFSCIIFGAPVLHSYEQTTVLSVLLTLLTISPAVFLVGASRTLEYIFCEKSEFLTRSEELSLELLKYNAGGAIFGAWAGTIVSPLDWDRDWQKYPIPNVFGALFGSGMANIYVCSKVLFTTGKLYLAKKRT